MPFHTSFACHSERERRIPKLANSVVGIQQTVVRVECFSLHIDGRRALLSPTLLS